MASSAYLNSRQVSYAANLVSKTLTDTSVHSFVPWQVMNMSKASCLRISLIDQQDDVSTRSKAPISLKLASSGAFRDVSTCHDAFDV